MEKQIKTALISVFHKDGIQQIASKLIELNISIYSTGETEKYLRQKGIQVKSVEELTSFPSILGGRLKTLHPGIFGGLLGRRSNSNDLSEMQAQGIKEIDLLIVDPYPFQEALDSKASEEELIEKIDIGGIAMIRAAAKNFREVVVISSPNQYDYLLALLNAKKGSSSLSERKHLAGEAFQLTFTYDSQIFNYFDHNKNAIFNKSFPAGQKLHYGENPHQQAYFYGNTEDFFTQKAGKELSYNNLLDIDAAIHLIAEFEEPTFALIKHNNACGLASDSNALHAWKKALSGDPRSAFGAVIICNTVINAETAAEINTLFYHILIAPAFTDEALQILKRKAERIILELKHIQFPETSFRSVLNGLIEQSSDSKSEMENELNQVTKKAPTAHEISDLLFANKIVKHTKSNAIVLVKNKQMIGSGMGQVSRIDALKQALDKAVENGFTLQGTVMASDAFFPFSDCVQIAASAGITAIIQPGGSKKDSESILACDEHHISMMMTGNRHFRH